MHTMNVKTAENPPIDTTSYNYRNFMIRELLIWLVGVPVPVATVIGLFVF